MALGQAFTEADAQGDGNRVVLSYGLWRRRFADRQDASTRSRPSTDIP